MAMLMFGMQALAACSANVDDIAEEAEVEESVETTEQALGPGGTCFSLCTATASCEQSCTVEAAQLLTMTCGQFGKCASPLPVACNYQPVTSPRVCRVDTDNHIWGTRAEVEVEALYRDVNNNPRCPEKWIQKVERRHDCPFVYEGRRCCDSWLGPLNCAGLMPGSCH